MIRGITSYEAIDFMVKEYDEPVDAADFIPELLGGLVK
jgi:hypothetical protein